MKQNSTNTEVPVFFSAYSEAIFISLIEDTIKKVMTQFNQNESTTYNPDELLTREEAAKEFKVSVATIDNYKRGGYIIPRRIGGSVRYKRGDLQTAFSGNIINPYKAVDRRKG